MAHDNEQLWLDRKDAAALCSLSPRQFDEVIRPRLPPGSERGSGHTLRLWGPSVTSTYVWYRLEQR